MEVTAYQGDSRTLRITVLDEAGAPLNLTGYAIAWTLYRVPNADTPMVKSPSGTGMLSPKAVQVLSKSLAGETITVTDAPGGEFELTLTPTDTATLAGQMYHKVEITSAGGVKSTVLTGIITFLRTAP